MSNYPPHQQQPGYPPYPGNPPPQNVNYQPTQQYYPPQQQPYYQQGQQPQAYYQQQQPYPQGNQMQYGQQAVVTVQPVQPVSFQQVPVRCQCPFCNHVITTKVSREIGTTTFLYCLMLSLVCCCCCPFCMDCAKDASHSCPNCKKHLATFNQPLVQSGGGGSSRQNYDPTYGGPGDDGCGRGPADDGGGGGGGGDGD